MPNFPSITRPTDRTLKSGREKNKIKVNKQHPVLITRISFTSQRPYHFFLAAVCVLFFSISPIPRWLGSRLPTDHNVDAPVILYFADFGSLPVKQHSRNGTKLWITRQQNTSLNTPLFHKIRGRFTHSEIWKTCRFYLASTHNQINHSTRLALILQVSSPGL